ncbi:MAG: hypothetical protein R3290_08680, partial [Acidimicrobiia bacterium]|nr:hypothetical protein [Acidimicrobiia bacterium]
TGLASQGDPTTRTAVFNVDPGETVTCTYVLRADTSPTPNEPGTATGGGGGGSPTGDGDAEPGRGVEPEDDDERLPLPDVLPDDTDASAIPRSGPWSVTHDAGALDCGVIVNEIPPSPPEPGTIEASDDGRRLVGSGFSGAPDPATGGEGQVVSVEFTRSPASPGRYVGSFTQDGLTVDYVAQVITSEYLVGYLFGSFSRSGVTCELYRPYVLEYAG